MSNNNQHKNIGLSLVDLEEILTNSKNPTVLGKHQNKIDNCDLSNAAVELISNDELTAVKNIVDEINNKYPAPSSNKNNNWKYLGLGILLLTICTFWIFNSEDPSNSNKKNISTPHVTTSKPNNEKEAITEAPVSITDKNENLVVKKASPSVNLSPDEKDRTEETLVEQNSSKDSLTTPVESKIRSNEKVVAVKTPKTAHQREVRAIKAMKTVDSKYKNQNYSLSSLVAFDGGEKNLERIILDKLKGKIKDEDIPQNNFSVVFKFTVNSRGKIKDVNVQSIVAPEVEQLIKETIFNLSNWNKGDKRIPVNYTVYVTFK